MNDTVEGTQIPEGPQSALVTGCGNQPGASIARYLHAEGWRVVATARSQAQLTDFDSDSCRTATLDLTDPEEPAAVIGQVIEEAGTLDALVHAHVPRQRGAVEDVPSRLVRRQFDATLFGLHRLLRAALPHMRESGAGRIVTVTGLDGRVSPPGAGIQASSQFAVEALQDALRAEVGPHGIDVVTVQPGPIEGVSRTEEPDAFDRSAAYADLYEFYSEIGILRGLATTSPEDVAEVVHQAVSCPNPAPRYPVGNVAAIALWARFLPDTVRDSLYGVLRRLP